MRTRPYFQVMGYWLNEPALLRPELALSAMEALAAEGYDATRVMLRNTNFSHRSPRVVEVIAAMVERAHQHGLRVALDCEPHATPVGRDMGAEFPEAMGERLVCASAPLVDGHFRLHIPNPCSDSQMPIFTGVEAAFVRRHGRVDPLTDFTFASQCVAEPYDEGYIQRESAYVTGKGNAWHRRHTHLSGRVADGRDGELLVYARYHDVGLLDFYADGFRQYFDALLACYRDIPLDGVGWDEPAVSGDWGMYRYGRAFAAAFQRENGYALRERLYLLDAPGVAPEAVQVRLDYYRTLNDGVFQAQRQMIATAHALFGDELLLGTHHTWQGEGGINDYRAGAVDYFRLNENMDAGYTDSWWWDDGSVNYTFALAGSLGRLTPSGCAECNTWDAKPTNALVAYYTRLMALMRVNWFNIWYGEDADTCRYPDHYTWAASNACMRRNQRLLESLGAARPLVDVAIWHGWEGVMALNRAEWASAHKAFCLNTATALLQRNIAFDFVDSSLLADATVADGQLVTRLERYRVLVLPYAPVLPRAAWQTCLRFAEAGGRVLFIGPPPTRTVEGDEIAADFAARVGMTALPVELYVAYVDAICTLPQGRAEKLEISYPLQPTTGRALRSSEDEVHGVAGNGVVYLSDLDPRHRLVELLACWLTPPVLCYSDSILWRLYQDGDTQRLLLIARRDREMSGLVRVAGYELAIDSGSIALLHLTADGLRVETDDMRYTVATGVGVG
ncbi:MAG TPA: hypothetical protein VGL77_02560 [Armatimonadota bacterium]